MDTERRTQILWAATRISLGWVFLWAFIDKLFGLGFATCRAKDTGAATYLCEKAWLMGGSPTTGFLKNANGVFADFFNALAGSAVVDWLFMLGLLGIGLALILGIGLNIAAWSGALLMVLMWAADLPLANNPFMDDHLIYAMLLLLIAWTGDHFGLGRWWKERPFVRSHPWLE